MALEYNTLAEGIISELPIRSQMIMEAMNSTDGAFTVVSEEDIEDGIKILARQGIYVEPTSAVVVKAFDHFVQTEVIRYDDLIVSVLTGSGLKATDKLTKMLSM
jgi:threonine synthase